MSGGVDAQCSASDWRSTPLAHNPSSLDEFDPLALGYYTGPVLKAVWPAFLGLGCFAALLLSYFLWRLIVVCRGCIHRRKRFQKNRSSEQLSHSIGSTTRGRKWSLNGKSGKVLRGSLAVLFFGVALGCMYGMIKVNSEVVDQGLATVSKATNYVDTVLGALDVGIDASANIDTALVTIQDIIDVNVNATDVTTQLQCLRPWLETLPDPAPLRAQVEAAIGYIVIVNPLLSVVAGNLSILARQDGAGIWSGTLPSLIQGKPELELIAVQAAAFALAASNLNSLTEIPGSVQTARDALLALLNSPPYTSKLATLNTTTAALTATEAAVVNADDSMNATIILANDLLDGPAESLSTTLEIFTYGYTAVRPCMTALNARTRTISETVMLLPDALQQNMVILNATQSKLDAVLQIDSAGGGPNMSQRLNQVLNDAAGQMQATEQAALQVSDARQQLTGTVQFDVLVASLNAVRGSMANAQATLTSLLNLMTVYVSGSPLALPYPLLASQVRAAGTIVGTYANVLQQWLVAADALYDQIDQVFYQLSNANFIGDLNALSTQLQELPSESMLAQIDDYASQVAVLPQPVTSIVDDAVSSVVDVVTEVSAAVADSRSVLGDAVGAAGRTSLTMRENTIGTVEEYTTEYEPTVRMIDSYRQAALYSVFAVALVLNLVLLAGAFLLWPAALKLAVILLLVLFLVSFAIVVAITAGLKVGTDGCANLEPKILEYIDDPQITTLANYYFYGQGSDPQTILNDVFDVDIDAALGQVVSARENLLSGIAEYNVRGAMQSAVDSAVNGSYAVVEAVMRTLYLIDYRQVNPVYVSIKQYPCCTVLDTGGGVWTGFLISGSCVFVQCILAMILIGLFDGLRLPGCCKIYFGKAGAKALQNAANGDGSFPDTPSLENSTSLAAGGGVEDAQKPPRQQSKIFRMFSHGSSSKEDENGPATGRRISITVATDVGPPTLIPAGTRASSGAPPPLEAATPPQRRSSNLPAPSAPLPP